MRYTVSAAAVALLVCVSPAGAQAPPGTVSWDGPYVGLGVGGEWGRLHGNATAAGTPAGAVAGSPAVPGSTVGLGGTDTTVTGGGQVGYNYQLPNNIVLGIEGDIRGGGPETGRTLGGLPAGFPNFAAGDHFHASSDWNASIRGRVGYAFDQWLLYATGGVAFANLNMNANYAARTIGGVAVPSHSSSDSSLMIGSTVGGGVEYAVTPNISVGGEYRYTDYGNETLHVGPVASATGTRATLATTPVHGHIGLEDNTAMLKVNYHFGAPPPPPPAMPAAMPAPPPPAAPKVFIVFFDWDKDTVTPQGHQIIEQAANAYRSGAPVQIQVTGYTDRSGSPSYNQRLSERRANNVAKALTALGVPRNQMTVSGHGENDNRVPTADGVREPQNRRVEITAP